MKLTSLKLKNFRQHADSEVLFPAGGIVGIVGPNGGGKSTVLEGAAWAIYGAKATRGTMAGLRWHRAPARRVAEAELVFEVGGKMYRIERTESNAKLFEGASSTPIAAGTDAVNTYMPGLIGMSLEEFSATYLCAQKDLARIAGMGPTERRQFFLSVMGVGKIDEALKACRARKNDLGKELDGLRGGLGEREPLARDLEAAQEDARARAEDLMVATEAMGRAAEEEEQARARFDASAARAERHLSLLYRLRSASDQVISAERELTRADEALGAAQRAAARLQEEEQALEPVEPLRAERRQLEEARLQVRERQTIQMRLSELDKDIRIIEENIVDARRQIEMHETEAQTVDLARYKSLDEEYSVLVNGRRSEQATAVAGAEAAEKEAHRITRHLEAIRTAGAEGACPTCARALGAQFNAVVIDLEEELHETAERAQRLRLQARELESPSDREMELDAELPELEERIRRVQQLARDAERAQRAIDRDTPRLADRREERQRLSEQLERMGEIDFSAERLQEVEAAIRRHEDQARALATLRAEAMRVPHLEQEAAARRATLEGARAQRATVDAEILELAFDREAHERLRSDVEEARGRATLLREQHARAEEALRGATERVSRAEQALVAYDARAGRLRELERELRTHEAAAQRLADFRAAQASSIRPELEELTSGCVAILTDGRHESVTLTDDFDVVLQEDGVDQEVVSGGTQDVAAIALRLATSQMIAERAGHPLSLMILDEPFGSLDEVRRGNVLSLIRRLGGVFEQVLVISHVAETRDAVDHVIEIDYDAAGGCSRVLQRVPAPAEPAPAELVAA